MDKLYVSLFYGAITTLFVCMQIQANAQGESSSAVLNIEKFANEEKRAFINLTDRVQNGLDSYRGSVASDNFDVNYYRCEWEIDPSVRFIKGSVTSYFTLTSATDKIVFDLSDTLNIDSIIYHGNTIGYQRLSNDGLQLQFPALMANGHP